MRARERVFDKIYEVQEDYERGFLIIYRMTNLAGWTIYIRASDG